MTTEDTTFFAAVAAAAAALVGLSFIALSFFLVDILKRYDLTALPVFRHRERTQARRVAHHWHPKQLTDRELLDGDPLVVFMAFSVAVTWNLFLMPLTIALTAAGGGGLPVLASEMTAFFGLFWFSFKVRNQKIDELRPYLTREELLWRPLGAIALSIYLVATVLVGLTALFPQGLPIGSLASTWRSWDPTSPRTAIILLKTACVSALLLGTYAVNKDMFIFFKSVATERMRQSWLRHFTAETYPMLQAAAATALKDHSWSGHQRLADLWHDGCPRTFSTHEAVRKASAEGIPILWGELLGRHEGTPGWMLDVPSIAQWCEEVTATLVTYRADLARRGSEQDDD